MLRTHTCGQLRIEDVGQEVTLCGWIQRIRNLGGMTFIDLRDRYGITQLVFNMDTNSELCEQARELGREFVLSVTGKIAERSNKNQQIPTGDIEIHIDSFDVLNGSKTPPFTIEDDTDGGEELRMKYRYLDLRRAPLKSNIELRYKVTREVRKYLDTQGFLEIETPVLIKSTPEGARDFVVPSRLNPGDFYALPQSPQTFKQLIMVAGFDKYFQIVKCFRDEDFRADRQPEFTQIDCEMSFVAQEDILHTFENLIKQLFKGTKNIDLSDFDRIPYDEAIRSYGSDSPDLRFDMKIFDLEDNVKEKGFAVFDDAEVIVGICAKGCATYSRKQLDELTDFVRKPQVGAKGLIYVKYNEDGTIKSSVDKFYDEESLKSWLETANAEKGDLLLILSGDNSHTRKALGTLRLEMGSRLELIDNATFVPVWVLDFPLLYWDDEGQRFQAMHHPFTAPKKEDLALMESDPGAVRANAYDLVINGVEVGGGSIRIHDRELQNKMFTALGFTKEEAEAQFGFLLNAFEYGAPPHGGIAFGFDRICALLGGSDMIREFIAFPKNNSGKDIMLDTPSQIDSTQLDDLNLKVDIKKSS